MARDLYQRPPGGPDLGRARLSRRALLGLGQAPTSGSETDHRDATAWVRAAWERDGHEVLLRQLEPVAEVVVGLAKLGPGTRVLDVGAGDGNVALAGARRGAEVAACDLAPAMVERGRARCGPDVEWSVAGAEELPYPDSDFDAVLSAFGAALAPRPEVATRELARVARPGAVVIVTAWIPRGLPGGLDKLAERLARPSPAASSASDWGVQAVARDRLAPLVEGLELRTRTVPLRFPDADAAFDALSRRLPLETDRLAALRPDFDALLRSTNDRVGVVEIPARYLIARGTRPES